MEHRIAVEGEQLAELQQQDHDGDQAGRRPTASSRVGPPSGTCRARPPQGDGPPGGQQLKPGLRRGDALPARSASRRPRGARSPRRSKVPRSPPLQHRRCLSQARRPNSRGLVESGMSSVLSRLTLMPCLLRARSTDLPPSPVSLPLLCRRRRELRGGLQAQLLEDFQDILRYLCRDQGESRRVRRQVRGVRSQKVRHQGQP